MTKINFKKLLRNKKILVIILVLISLSTYLILKSTSSKNQQPTYTTAKAEKGTLINSVSGSGQIVAFDEIEIKPKISGEITYLNLKNGKKVNRGDLLVELDSTEAQKNVWDAKINLANAQLSSKDLSQESNDSLAVAYNNTLNSLTSNYKDISTLLPNIRPLFEQSSYNSSEQDNNDADYYLRLVRFIQKNRNVGIDLSYWTQTVEKQYLDIEGKYSTIQSTAWALNNSSDRTQIEDTLNQTYSIDKEFLDLIRQTLNLTQKYQYLINTENISTPIAIATTTSQIAKLSELNSSLISHVNDLKTIKDSLASAKDASKKVDVNSETQELTIKQKELDLKTANETLNSNFIYATLAGVLTSVNTQLKIGDTVSNATAIATIASNQQIAEITLNEVDVAKVKFDQKASITFDAIEDLTLTGKVIEVDDIGTTDQGVVTYGVKIAFDEQDSRIKQGMSASVEIITDIKTDIFAISSSAIKTDSTGSYVEILNTNQTISKKYITVGISNDTQTEIQSGLTGNENIITKTSTATSKKTSTTSATKNAFSIPGMQGGPR